MILKLMIIEINRSRLWKWKFFKSLRKNISSKGYDYDKINFENDKLPEDQIV